MRSSRLMIAPLIAALLLATAGLAQQGGTPSIASQMSSVTEFDVNGLKVILKKRASAPTVAAGLFIRGGVRNYTDKTAGIEMLMLNSAVEAGQTFSRPAVRRELASTGSSISASASNDFSVVALASTRDSFDRTWKIFTDVTMKPLFDPADVNRIKDQMISALREQQTAPDSALSVLEDRVIFSGHPYANDPSGSIQTLTPVTPAQLRDHHKKVMETSRLLLVVVGDIDAEELKAKVASTFGTLPKGSYSESPLPALDFSKPTLEVVSRPLPTNYVLGDFAAPTLGTSDYYAMRVATSILANRIFQEVRVNRQLSYAPNADLSNMGVNTGNIYVTAVDANQAVSVMLKEIDRLKREPVSSSELTSTSGEFLTNYYVKQQTNFAQVGDLARYELIGGGWRNSFEFLNRINQVTPDAVRSAAGKYMKNLRFVVIGDPSAIDRSVFIGTGADTSGH